jgi:hypothetical protein
MAMLKKGTRWPCQPHAHLTEKEAVACEKRAGEAGARLRALVAQWRKDAEQEDALATTIEGHTGDISARYLRCCADELDALLSAPVVSPPLELELIRNYSVALEFVREMSSQACPHSCGGDCLACRAKEWLHTPQAAAPIVTQEGE